MDMLEYLLSISCSISGTTDPTAVPPTTPYSQSLPASAGGRKVRLPDEGGTRPLNSTPPLPPITPSSARSLSREGELLVIQL